MKPIIESMLDTDLYKLSMMQAVFHQYPNATGEYEFKCRNEGVKLGFLKDQVIAEIKNLENLCLTQDERNYLLKLGYFKEDYLEYLINFKYDASNCDVECTPDGDLTIETHGKWLETILFEVPVLAIVNELYFRYKTKDDPAVAKFKNGEYDGLIPEGCLFKGDTKLTSKICDLSEFPRLTFAEFGTRRRFSSKWQKHVLTRLHRECPQLVGTSNVHLAMNLGIKPIGTVAHEWIMSHLGLVDNIKVAQKRAMHVWQQEYGSYLGIMLTDTFTTEAFFKDFDKVLAEGFDGCRHDSGDPIKFGYRVIEHYKKLNIDPRTKTIVFSDGLDIPEAIRIYKEFTGLIGVSFGIGTNLSNDCSIPPLNIVIKLLELNGTHLIKLSDVPGKTMGDPEMVEKVKQAYGLNKEKDR